MVINFHASPDLQPPPPQKTRRRLAFHGSCLNKTVLSPNARQMPACVEGGGILGRHQPSAPSRRHPDRGVHSRGAAHAASVLREPSRGRRPAVWPKTQLRLRSCKGIARRCAECKTLTKGTKFSCFITISGDESRCSFQMLVLVGLSGLPPGLWIWDNVSPRCLQRGFL